MVYGTRVNFDRFAIVCVEFSNLEACRQKLAENEQVGHAAAEVGAQLVHDVRARAVAAVIQDFGQRHPIDARGLGHLLNGDAPRLLELLLLDLLGKLETDHAMLHKNV